MIDVITKSDKNYSGIGVNSRESAILFDRRVEFALQLTYKNSLLLILSVLWICMIYNLGSWGVLESSEARYAEISRTMLVSGNWLLPELMDIYHFDKPIITYWITAAGMKLFGVCPFGARFFLSLAYIFQIFLVFKIALAFFSNHKVAFISALVYAGTPLVIMSVSNLTTDAYLNFFELLAVWIFIYFLKENKRKYLYAFFLTLGVLILIKGPVGLLIPILMIYPCLKLLGRSDHLNMVNILLGTLATIMIGGTWFFYLMIRFPEMKNFLIGEQLSDRFFNAKNMGRSEPVWYYFIYFPLVVFPLIGLLPRLIKQVLMRKIPALSLLALFGIVLPFLFFSVSSSKLIMYILPICPYFAILVGWSIGNLSVQHLKAYFIGFASIYFLLLAGVMILGLGVTNTIPVQSNFSFWIFNFAGATLLLYLYQRVTRVNLALIVLLMPISVAPALKSSIGQIELDINSTLPITDFIQEKNLENRNIMIWDKRLPSIPFQLNKPIVSLYNRSRSLDRNVQFQENEQWKSRFIDVKGDKADEEIVEIQSQPTVLVAAQGKLPPEYQWISDIYPNVVHLGKWDLFY